ncbi:galactosylgalactosylxylosylprotein 3-beta-glucuronosyltransferase I isoform X1 [Colletes gigas]|uniref:galactosylgalactosylxylosylprotein 3-beta-glucuronosyltransferase I isoform X1 n=2 Tax=Colletes gigas TaxID=935657 RepID=UPI001C9B0308|nr:galactosylgalactosylxylosylprotein 3-beta-glucuronosyltransferase I isoform X1 [Colletes gigas]
MTESLFLTDEFVSKPNMWGGYRHNKVFLVLLLMPIILIQTYIYYREQCKWLELRGLMDSLQADQRDANRLSYTIMKLIEKNSVLSDSGKREYADKPTIYVITPTFARPVQKAELTRLSQTFLHVPNLHWIVVEDAAIKTMLVTRFLLDSDLRHTHLNAVTPPNYKLGRNDPNWKKPRGVEQRNEALRWLRDNVKLTDKGVVYFADDDNTYSVKLFHEMAKIQKVGVWPVGLVGGLMVEKPICDNVTNKVIDFNAVWKPDRPFPLDMAGFAINVTLLLENKEAEFSYDVQGGYQESEILKQIVTRNDLEPLADLCTKVYVWHTRTEPPQLNVEQLLIKKGKRSNAGIEV